MSASARYLDGFFSVRPCLTPLPEPGEWKNLSDEELVALYREKLEFRARAEQA